MFGVGKAPFDWFSLVDVAGAGKLSLLEAQHFPEVC